MQEIEIKPQSPLTREIGTVTAEIRELCAQAKAMAVAYIVEIGRRLYEAKGMLAHGEWGEWLKNEVGFSHSTANNYMKIFDEYGANQMTIFGAVANSQTIGNLPYSKALALLAVPSSEREEFAEKVNANDLTVKELEKAIQERDEERKRNAELAEKVKETEKARKEAAERAQKVTDLENKLAEAKKKMHSAQADAAAARADLEAVKNSPKISDEELAKIKTEAVIESENKINELNEEIEKLKDAVNDAKAEKTAAAEAKKAAEEEVKTLRAQAKLSDPEVVAFKAYFEGLQDHVKKCKQAIEQIRAKNPELAEKLAAALAQVGKVLTNG